MQNRKITRPGFVERNAGKLLITALALALPFGVIARVMGDEVSSVAAFGVFGLLAFCAIGGYVARATSASSERQDSAERESKIVTVNERNEMMRRILAERS